MKLLLCFCLLSAVSTVLARSNILCTDVTLEGAYATCPEGYALRDCSCGSVCSTWETQSEDTCHCQCDNVDWTSVHCCRV
ncbi:resistin-like isoform X2 [Rana temporaria]|nr:resistin-like isoform X2 [Rana temporaria]